MLFVEYPLCTTCKKAKKFLESQHVSFEARHIKDNPPTIEELTEWHRKRGLPLQKFFNTSGQVYRSMGLKDKLPTMSDQEKIQLLATDGMLVKRPILVLDNVVLVGFKIEEWTEALNR